MKPLFGYGVAGGEPPQGQILNYLMAGNGVFAEATRSGLSARIPIAKTQIKGLPELEPYVKIPAPVPKKIMLEIWQHCIFARNLEGNLIEIVFHLWWENDRWEMAIPPQQQSATSCQPKQTSSYAKALIEIHSHGAMPAFFSGEDDADETGFRVYAVLGQIQRNWTHIATRVGIYRDRYNLPANAIFELPDFFFDTGSNYV